VIKNIWNRIFLFSLILILNSACVQHQTSGRMSEQYYAKVPIEFANSGHAFITAEINSKQANLMLDTGAGKSVIHIGQIDYLGLESKEHWIKAAGIGTSNYKSREVFVPRLVFDLVKYRNPEFIGIDLFHIERITPKPLHGILGGEFLRRHGAVIDYKNSVLLLEKPIF
jgi:hypothetical protein